jgi:hypothetical protein
MSIVEHVSFSDDIDLLSYTFDFSLFYLYMMMILSILTCQFLYIESG